MVASCTPPPTGSHPKTWACTLTRNRTGDPLVCKLVLSLLSHTRQDSYLFCFVLFIILFYFIFKILFTYFYREGKGGQKTGRENLMYEGYINQLPVTYRQPWTWSAIHACALTGNRTGDLLVPRPAFSPLSHTSQGHYLFL